MKMIAAIRTNKWTDEEERLLTSLRPAFGADVTVVFHDRGPGVAPPLPVVDVSAEWVSRNRLPLAPDWGWRCGDYFYYALRQARPGFDAYWLIEPDVHFTSDSSEFFGKFASAGEDALGYQLGPFGRDIRFVQGLPGMAHHRAIFALTRFSGRALDRLFELRKAMSDRPLSVRDYPNDEIFCFSHMSAQQDMSCGRLEDYAPGWFENSQFATDPDLLFEVVQRDMPAGRVLHPVRGRTSYKKALGRRLIGNLGLLMRIRDAIDLMSAEDIEDISQEAADQVRRAITDLHSRRALRHKRRARTR